MRIAAVLAGLALAGPAVAAPAPELRVATLACGGTRFALRSRVWPARDAPLAPVSQAASAGGLRPVRLEDQGMASVGGWRVRRAYVGAWACVRSDRGKAYVSLQYACGVDVGQPGACTAGKEWYRLLDARGRPADEGVPPDGAARDRLLDRLGLARVMEQGVPMHDVLSSP